MLFLPLCSDELSLIVLLLTWIKAAFGGPNLPCMGGVYVTYFGLRSRMFTRKKIEFVVFCFSPGTQCVLAHYILSPFLSRVDFKTWRA